MSFLLYHQLESTNMNLHVPATSCTFCLLYRSLQQFVAWRKAAFLFKDDRNNNVMHLIAQGGHLDTAKAMLKNDYVEFKKG